MRERREAFGGGQKPPTNQKIHADFLLLMMSFIENAMDQRTPPSGFYSYNAAQSAQPPQQNVYRSNPGPPIPMAYAASPMAYGYNYTSYNRSAAPAWSTAQPAGVPQYAYPNSAQPNVLNTTSVSQPQQEPQKTWTCDACDVTLESERALKAHRKSHVKCTECSFEGAPKIVKVSHDCHY